MPRYCFLEQQSCSESTHKNLVNQSESSQAQGLGGQQSRPGGWVQTSSTRKPSARLVAVLGLCEWQRELWHRPCPCPVALEL